MLKIPRSKRTGLRQLSALRAATDRPKKWAYLSGSEILSKSTSELSSPAAFRMPFYILYRVGDDADLQFSMNADSYLIRNTMLWNSSEVNLPGENEIELFPVYWCIIKSRFF